MSTAVQAALTAHPADGWDQPLSGPERFRPLHLLRTTPLSVWVLTALFGLVLACWSVLVPQYHAPDEPNHTDAVMRLVQGQGWPHPGGVVVTPDGVGAIANSPHGTREEPYSLTLAPIPEQDATPRADRPSWDELGAGQPPGAVQQIVQHPPLYYWVDATVLRLLPGGGDDLRWDVVIGTLRLLSVLMVAPLPLLAFHGARKLTGDENAARVAAIFPLAVPQLTHIGSTVNNDNLLILASSLATLVIVYVLRGDTSLRTAAFAGVFVGLALFSKSLAIVFVPMAAAAYLLAWRRARRDAKAAGVAAGPAAAANGTAANGTAAAWGGPGDAASGGTAPTAAVEPASAGGRDNAPFLLADAPGPTVPARALRFPWRPLLLGGVLAALFGGWWWVVNVVRYRTFQPETPGFPPGKYLGDWGLFADYLFNGTIGRWWGAIGWFEVNLPRVLAYAASAAVVALFALGMARARGGRARVNLAVLLWPTWALFGLMAYQAAGHFADTMHVTGISGRYLFAGLASVAIGVGAGAAGFGRRLSRWMPLLFLVAAAAMQAYAASLVFTHFWEPDGASAGRAWDAMAAWSPWSPATLTTLASLTAVAAAAAAVACIAHGVRHARPRA